MDAQQSPAEVDRLLMAVLEQSATPDESRQLAELMKHDAALRRRYCQWMALRGELQWQLSHEPSVESSSATITPAAPRQELATRSHRWPLVALAGCVLLAAWLIASRGGRENPNPLEPNQPRPEHVAERPLPVPNPIELPEPLPAIVAGIRRVGDNVEWGDGQVSLAVDSLLTVGQSVSLLAGQVDVSFHHGAVITLHGPAKIVARSPDEVQLLRGLLVAEVPNSAVGFVVDAPSFRVVDLGTEFGVSDGDGRAAEVHVFKGVVEVTPKNSAAAVPPTRLSAGAALRISPNQLVQALAADPATFGLLASKPETPPAGFQLVDDFNRPDDAPTGFTTQQPEFALRGGVLAAESRTKTGNIGTRPLPTIDDYPGQATLFFQLRLDKPLVGVSKLFVGASTVLYPRSGDDIGPRLAITAAGDDEFSLTLPGNQLIEGRKLQRGKWYSVWIPVTSSETGRGKFRVYVSESPDRPGEPLVTAAGKSEFEFVANRPGQLQSLMVYPDRAANTPPLTDILLDNVWFDPAAHRLESPLREEKQ